MKRQLLFAFAWMATAITPAFAVPVAFIDVNVVPMDRDHVLAHQTVVADGGKIVSVGPVARVKVPAGAVRVPAKGKYLMPGLADMHVHLAAPTELPLYLANGVTTVLNMSGVPADLEWRKAVAEGALIGPRIFSTGPAMSAPRTPQDSVGEVDRVADAGYDGVKVYSQVSAAEYPALAAEAHKRHLRLIGHIPWQVGLAGTLAAGQSLAHIEELIYNEFTPGPKGARIDGVRYDEARIDAVARQIAQSGVYVETTLVATDDIARQATALPGFLKDPHLRYLPPWIMASLRPENNRYANRYSAEELAVLRKAPGFARKLARALDQAGVPLLAGTDGTVIGPVAGFSLQEELHQLVEAGLTPYSALRTATANPGRFLGDGSGTVVQGQRADLVLLDANPLSDVGNAGKISGVLAGGRWLDRARLDAMVAAVPSAHVKLRQEVAAQMVRDPAHGMVWLSNADPQGLMGAQVMLAVLKERGEQGLEHLLDELRASQPNADFVSEDSYNNLGYGLMAEGQLDAAEFVLRKNVRDFPRSANAADSLADVLIKRGDIAGAKATYRRALQLDPVYGNADGAKKFIAAHP